MTTSGTPSECAWATAPNEFSVPGPCCMANTPTRSPDVRRLMASAMWMPVRSWRTMIVRMSASAAASISGLTGYPIRQSTPSRLRISATAAATFMARPSYPARVDHIPTTHTGSLPRPDDLVALLYAETEGQLTERDALDRRVREAVADSVNQQSATGIEIVN